MIGLPPCSFSALSITGVSVLSITSGEFTDGEAPDHLVHLGNFVAADEGGADVERVGALADLLAPHRRRSRPSRRASCNSRHFFEPLALQRSPIEKKAFSCRSATC